MNARNLSSRINKDNTLISTLIAATLIVVASGAASNGAFANHAAEAFPLEMQRMEPIVVTARRGAAVKLETVTITASRISARA